MQRLMFYCQHILGIGHLVRSIEIVRGLLSDFEVFFINGGEVVEGFDLPDGLQIINIPAIKTDSEFRELQIPADFQNLEQVLAHRRDLLLTIFEQVQPTALMVELFPFGRRRFSTELIPLMERARATSTKVVCSLRDIVVTKQDRAKHEEKICRLINQYFDLLLIHGDPKFMPLETSFSRISDLNCQVHYTGYVTQQVTQQEADQPALSLDLPLIVTSVGGGRFGHELLECVAETSALLETQIPHQIQMFTGPFSPDDLYDKLCQIAQQRRNLSVERFTPHLLQYMQQAELSISMAGYNTTMNVLTTGVRAMLLPFIGNDDQEQRMRSERLEELGIVSVIQRQELQPERFAQKIIACLQQTPAPVNFDMQGVEKTAQFIKALAQRQTVAAETALA
ncbi:MAG: glycosyl transferase [Pegethrix bostrychoides GSE-TBD4-15B]|uniref:Glycosyl transferase n=1 Tax=Pegethrix bostrychoides GSE-TBD4-15B TaxID=2839662 RepID=A0A951P9T4_9CYAN|nr:glycosyl transferase [Pegethrix bostrychoides GSE-TBD4-15B]